MPRSTKTLSHRLRFEGLEDRRMLTDFVVTNNFNSGAGSLRAAIDDANDNPGLDRVFFSLSASEMSAGITINSLPLEITGPVQILGDNISNPTLDPVTIRAGATATNAFEVDSITGGGITNGFVFQDIIIDGAFNDGIHVDRLPSNGELLINRVGVFNTNGDGVDISPAIDNVSITIQLSSFAVNGAYGIHAHNAGNSSTNLTINSNEIVGNGTAGIRYNNFDAPINIINNNIGITDLGGPLASSNNIGIWIGSSSSTASSQIDNNIISGNENNFFGAGILVQGSQYPQLVIHDNGIGTDLNKIYDPLQDFGNDVGIDIQNNSTIGQIDANFIVGNNTNGINVFASDGGTISNSNVAANGAAGIRLAGGSDGWSLIQNVLGSGVSPDRGNVGDGLLIEDSFNAALLGQTIGYNGGNGVTIIGESSDRHNLAFQTGTSNNFFTNNTGIPIDLGDDSQTLNDSNDEDSGPNNRLNYPDLLDGSVGLVDGNWLLPFEIDVDAAGTYEVQLFKHTNTGLGSGSYEYLGTAPSFTLTSGQIIDGIDAVFTVIASNTSLSPGDQVAVILKGLPGAGGITETNTGNSSEMSPVSAPIVADTLSPTITDVRLNGSGWTGLDAYEFSTLVANGEQFKPIFTEGADTLEIVFSEHVLMDGTELSLMGTDLSSVTSEVTGYTFNYHMGSHTATWTFTTPLADGKYAIHLDDSITDTGGNMLDAEWDNPDNNTPDHFADDILDDEYKSNFATGNGIEGTIGSEFRFHFALLAGDYDGDGIVEASESATGDGDGNGTVGDSADLAIGTVGDILPLRAVDDADFNDDEIVNGIDLARWEANYGKSTIVTHAMGDANGDGKVNTIDLRLWEEQYGNSPDPQFSADFDGDGDVDGDDFLTWQQNQGLGYGDANGDTWASGTDFLIWQTKSGLTSAWYVAPEIGFQASTIGSAPVVNDVVISGSVSTHTPFSFDSVDGDGGQLATVPVGGADTISIVFSENVNVSAESLEVMGLTTANVPAVAEFIYDASTFTATWRFEGWTIYGDNYLLSLKDAVTDVEGNLLDGEWTNPKSISTTNTLVSEFPSGDGIAGGNFNFAMTLLPGDVDLDGDVDSDDLGILLVNWDPAGLTNLFIDGDLDGDGAIDPSDSGQLFVNWQTNLQTVIILADLNGDSKVTNGDLNTITDNLGMTGATYADGDLDGDGDVDQDDLDLAFSQYGIEIDLVA